jgi:hypothetical protein
MPEPSQDCTAYCGDDNSQGGVMLGNVRIRDVPPPDNREYCMPPLQQPNPPILSHRPMQYEGLIESARGAEPAVQGAETRAK